jgi:AcrR family transcriptional regulator
MATTASQEAHVGTAESHRLDAATWMAGGVGFVNLTVDRILAAARVSRAAFYRYFSNADDCCISYTRAFSVKRWHRDAKIYDIFEDTAEIQRLVIARAISGMHVK